MAGIIREAFLKGSGGTEVGTFRKAPGGGKGWLEPSWRQGAKGGWRFQVAGIFSCTSPACPARLFALCNSACVTGTPAMAPTHRMTVGGDCAIKVLSTVPGPQSVPNTCWH